MVTLNVLRTLKTGEGNSIFSNACGCPTTSVPRRADCPCTTSVVHRTEDPGGHAAAVHNRGGVGRGAEALDARYGAGWALRQGVLFSSSSILPICLHLPPGASQPGFSTWQVSYYQLPSNWDLMVLGCLPAVFERPRLFYEYPDSRRCNRCMRRPARCLWRPRQRGW